MCSCVESSRVQILRGLPFLFIVSHNQPAAMFSVECALVTMTILLLLILLEVKKLVRLVHEEMLKEVAVIKDYTVSNQTLLECLVDPHIAFSEEQLQAAGADCRPGQSWQPGMSQRRNY